MRRLTQPCTLNCTGPQCSRRATGPHGPHIGVLGMRSCKNDTLLKDGKGRKLRAGWHERNVERDQFGSRTGLLGVHDPNRLSWRVRAQRGGLRGAACAGRGRTSCAGGGRSREPCATTLAVARKSCASRAASTPACDAFGGHGKKARRRASSQGVARGSKRQRSM